MTSITADLQNIDLGPVNVARDAIRGALDNPDVQRLLSGDSFEIALGGLGSAVGDLRASASLDASALLRPIVDAVSGLTDHLDLDSLPIGDLSEAVEEGIGIILRLVSAVQDPSKLGEVIQFDRILEAAGSLTHGFSTAGGDIGRLGAFVDRLEAGFGGDARALATFAADALLPFGGRSLLDLRARVDAIVSGSASLSLPTGRMAGLLLAVDAVAHAGGNPQQLARAVADLQRIRTSTLETLRDDLRQLRDAFHALHVVEALDAIISAAGAIRAGENGFLEMLETWRSQIATVRRQVEAFDAAAIHEHVVEFLDMLEEQARAHIERPIDDAVASAQEFVRGLFRDLPHRRVRAEISAFLANIAHTIRDLELDRVAREANAVLDRIEEALDPDALVGEVQAVLADVRALADAVLDGVGGALEAVVGTIQAVETQLQDVLARVVEVLHAFSTAMNEITVAIETLGVEEATDQVVSSIRQLRETAEKLLGGVPLPEPMKPMIEQVISTLESIDFEVVLAPVKAATEQLKIPNEVKNQITEALEQVAEKLENAIPAALVESIRAEVDSVLETIRGFDPAGMLDGVTQYIEEAAQFLEGLDPVAAAQQIRGPFQAVLDAIDAVHPRRLLAPVIDGYNSLVGSVSVPDITGILQSVTGAVNSAGASITQQLVTPIGHLTGGQANVSAGTGGAAQGGSGGTGGGAPGPQPGGGGGGGGGGSTSGLQPKFKPGDVVRFFGWIPARLRESLQALPETAVGDAISAIDSITGGLARDFRLLRTRILELETRIVAQLEGELRLVAEAQVRAQLSLHAGGPGLNVDISIDALASVSSSEMLRELEAFVAELRGVARDAADSAGGNAAVVLDRAATALETFRLSAILGSAEDFLAALDPEPIAAEIDALFSAIIARTPDLFNEAAADLQLGLDRLRKLLEELNPAAQARKFFSLVDILREELNVLNPAVLADELGMIHAVIRETIAAYDPVVLAENVRDVLENLAASLRALNPAALLGDLDVFGPIIAKIEQANPAAVLENVGTSLAEVGEELRALDPRALLDAIETLVPRLVDAFGTAIEAIKDELVALLESIRYATANASASASVSVSE
jgi:citrate lyase gamma subunit